MTVPPHKETLLVCTCQRTMAIDGRRLAEALGAPHAFTIHTELCRGQTSTFADALAGGGPVHVACTQEAPLFREIAEEQTRGDVPLTFTNIRERAGWCKSDAVPKMAALLAEARHVSKPAGSTTLKSEGVCLVYGAGQTALDAAQRLAGRLSVTLLLADAAGVFPPSVAAVPVFTGRIRTAKGHLGAFEIEVNGYAPVLPSSRAGLEFALTRDGAKSTCDLILDLSGGKPLFAGSAGRDGYLHVDPNDPVAVANALFDLADLVGEFEKPLYVGVDAATCAHARSQKVGCTRCLDTCPTGAIAPVGDHVAVDPGLCGGCGTCSAVCPTGAISYAFPGREDLIARVQIMLRTYRAAGGRRPVVLLHDERHGGGLIAAMARGGNGLPPNVLPMTLYSVFQIGHDSLAAILAAGAEQIVVMVPPDRPHDVPALAGQIDLLSALLGGLGYAGPRLHLLSEQDPDAAETFLYGLSELPGLMPHAVPLEGSKRHIARGVLAQLAAAAPTPQSIVALPKGAPYGRIHIDTAGCTLCLSCVGACPAHAIGDAPDRPQVAFTEAACVQCGICVATCPERVITLEPRYNFLPAALSPEVLNSEEPFACVRCGKPFGTKATIAKIVGRLAGHSMFRNEKQLRIVQMCDTCRVVTVSEEGIDPFRGGERPRIRTTDDYLAERAKKTGKTPDDFLS